MMLKSLTFSSALFASVLAAGSDNPEEKYPDFAQWMGDLGYTWEAFDVETDDGYILTTFHITGNENKEV